MTLAVDYIGKHRDDNPRPACTCARRSEVFMWYEHYLTCAIRAEVRERLHLSERSVYA